LRSSRVHVFCTVGQALSVRQDLIPEEYAVALSTLQDQVPPFDSAQAREILQRELGIEKFAQLGSISTGKGPVASASIGQVYRGFIDDTEVAVKVQRPNVLAEIALDLFIVRELFAPVYQRVTRTGTDLVGLASEWGRGFIAELDYKKEAASTIRFNEEMQKRNLNAVCAPSVLLDYSTEQILVTEWVAGTRLDQSDSDDIPRLCAVALNAYLVMLLELKSLHCDPHPGNLLRTNDGKLCILDFGMTLDIDPNLQYSLLEYVAHLTAENYESLPDDFVKLGFLKEEKLEFVRRSGVLEPLKYFLKQISQGGGADAVRERIFTEYREKYQGMNDDELRVEMRAEMKVRTLLCPYLPRVHTVV
jgi:predicted unusual protein kinase regulating ubiquinone biosynthesis (AarF/ABC1/UbiB family)